MKIGAPRDDDHTPLERRAQAAALAAAPVLVVLGGLAALLSPEAVSAEATPTTGGLAFGAATFVLATGLPQLLFGLGLRRGTPGVLTAIAVAAPIWAVWFGFVPLVTALIGGWDGLAPLAVAAAAAAGVLDLVVFVAARRGLRRLDAGGPATPRDGAAGA